ncbi:MAG: hypothetical protein IPK83_03790 [Planctomycetes bacterium]|nr:hypothetical protein [Planctomycetota bacterium]
MSLLFVAAGLGCLIAGGELLVRGASSLARSFGVSAIVVGLTIVAAGTSAPELVVGVMAAAKNNSAICAGNAVGSNIFNILLIVGTAAVICPLKASAAFVRRETPIMIGVSLLFAFLASDGILSMRDAVILLVAFIFTTAMHCGWHGVRPLCWNRNSQRASPEEQNVASA